MSTPHSNSPYLRPHSQQGHQGQEHPGHRETIFPAEHEQGGQGQGQHSNGESSLPPSQAYFPGSLISEASPAQDGPQHPYPPMMHSNMMPFMSPMHMQMMQQQQQQHIFFAQQQRQLQQLQQQHQQHQDQANKPEELSDHMTELRLQATTPDNMPRHNMDSFRDGESPRLHPSPLRDSNRRSPLDRHSLGSVPFGMGVHNPMMHPAMFSGVNPNFDPSMVPVQTPNGLVFVPMNRMTPPPGFGHFPMPMSDQGTGSPLPQPGQLPFHSGFHHHPQIHHQMFMQHQHIQAQNRLGSTSSFAQDMHHGPPDQSDQSEQRQGESQNTPTGAMSGQPEPSQQHQIKDIENQINHLLFRGEPSTDSPPPQFASGNRPQSGHLTVQEIEKAQELSLHNPGRRVSLADPVTPPRSRSIPTTVDHLNNAASKPDDSLASTLASKVSFNSISSRHVDSASSQPQYDPTAAKTPFSVKDIDFYSDRKYDPYRPSMQTFDLITRDASFLCAELLPNPAEETRKLALLQRYALIPMLSLKPIVDLLNSHAMIDLFLCRLSEISIETFGEAEVLPFGSSGNGLALANADMDVCVFLNAKEGEEEVSPAEFVERIGDRLEKEPDFENVLQLRKARVPIVKLNHINGIACDIGYQNDLAIWNTRLLRAYCKTDRRVRDIVVIVKQWAKKRKINNPYTGSLSRFVFIIDPAVGICEASQQVLTVI